MFKITHRLRARAVYGLASCLLILIPHSADASADIKESVICVRRYTSLGDIEVKWIPGPPKRLILRSLETTLPDLQRLPQDVRSLLAQIEGVDQLSALSPKGTLFDSIKASGSETLDFNESWGDWDGGSFKPKGAKKVAIKISFPWGNNSTPAIEIDALGKKQIAFTARECRKEATDPKLLQVGRANARPFPIEIRVGDKKGSAYFYDTGKDIYLLTDSHVLRGTAPSEVQFRTFVAPSDLPGTREAGQLYLRWLQQKIQAGRKPPELPQIGWRIAHDYPEWDLVALKPDRNISIPKSELQSWAPNAGPRNSASISSAVHSGISIPVLESGADSPLLTLLGVPGKGSSGSPILDEHGVLLGQYQDFQYAGFRSFSIKAEKIQELLAQPYRSKVYWDKNGGRVYDDGVTRIAESGTELETAGHADAGLGHGDGGPGHGGDGGPGHGGGPLAASSFKSVRVISYKTGEKRTFADGSVLLPLKPFQHTICVNNKVVQDPELPIYSTFHDVIAILKAGQSEKNSERIWNQDFSSKKMGEWSALNEGRQLANP